MGEKADSVAVAEAEQIESESEKTIAEDSQNEPIENPWPKLNKFFVINSALNKNLCFECLLCQPKKTVISTYLTSHFNFRKHVKVKYTEYVAK